MPLYASIDVGSNTFRLLIAEVKDKRIYDIFSDRKITRLGDRIHETGRLQEKNIENSVNALKEFSLRISKHDVRQVSAVATSALREASNANMFIQRASDETGISIEVISGEKEANLNLKGIISSFTDPESLKKLLFIVDIGGGSTEWIIYKNNRVIDMGSIPIGVIKLAESFLKTDPIAKNELNEMIKEICSVLKDLKPMIGNLIDGKTQFIGTGGTFTTLASIDLGLDSYSREKIHMHTIPYLRLMNMYKTLISLSLDQRKKVKGLEPERADLIIPGIQFTINFMDFFHFHELMISDYGLLEGALLETYEKNISET